MRAALLLLCGLAAGCASTVPDFAAAPQPVAPPEAGQVILFTGLNWSGESHYATGTDALAQAIRRAGVPSHVYRPGEWAAAAAAVLAARPAPAPLAVYGYSAGGPAAARFAARLAEQGVPVETLVVLESWYSATVPCGTGRAVQFRLQEGDALVPAEPRCAEVRNVVLDAALAARGGGLGHLSVAADAEVRRLLLRQLLDGPRVRRRHAPP